MPEKVTRTVVEWQCRLCSVVYADKAEAEACEARGTALAIPPVGAVYLVTYAANDQWREGDPVDHVEARVPVNPKARTRGPLNRLTPVPDTTEHVHVSTWHSFSAWQEKGGVRTRNSTTTGMTSWPHKYSAPPHDHPAYAVVIAELKRRGIEPKDWSWDAPERAAYNLLNGLGLNG